MKPNFALDLSHDGIRLLHRGNGGWALVGEVALDDTDMGGRLEGLRRIAQEIEPDGIFTKLIIPNSQILYTTVEAPGPDDIAREVQIRAALDGLTPYQVGDLVFDWRADGDKSRVAVLARETMDEAEAFAVEYQFNPVSFAARPENGEFSGEPFFGKTREAGKILGTNAKVTPDASPVPKRPRPISPPPDSRLSAFASEEVAQTPAESDAAPKATTTVQQDSPIGQDLQGDQSGATDDTNYDTTDPFSDSEVASQFPTGTPDVETEEPIAPPQRRSRSRKDIGDDPVTPPQLAPFPPTPDDDFTPQPSPRSREAQKRATTPKKVSAGSESDALTDDPDRLEPIVADATPKSPTSTSEEFYRRPEAGDIAAADTETRNETPVEPTVNDRVQSSKAILDLDRSKRVDTSPSTATESPPSFASRRTGSDIPSEDVRTPQSDRLSTIPARIAISGDTGSQEGSFEEPAPSSSSTIGKKAPESPTLAAPSTAKADRALLRVDKARADMADALAKPLPRPGVPLPKGTTKSSQTGVPSGAVQNALKTASGFIVPLLGRLSSTAEKLVRKDKASEAGAAVSAPPAIELPQPRLEPAATRSQKRGLNRLGLQRRSSPQDAKKTRSNDADALTVFGARKDQEIGGKPKYLGVILVLALLLLMAIVGIWSSLFGDEGGSSLFNPAADPEVSSAEGQTQPGAAPVDPGSGSTATPTQSVAESGEVLSREAAEARYAATGIWQRSPDALAVPETSRLSRLPDASIAEATPQKGSSPSSKTAPEAIEGQFADPIAPPPAGTTFDLDADGLVRPSAAGTISPTGTIVFSGRPPVVPPRRPGTPPPPTEEAPETPPIEPVEGTSPEVSLPPLNIPAIRPSPRPANLVPENASLETVPTPDPRPETLVAAAASETISTAISDAVADAVQSAFADSSELAVPTSPKPSPRPRDFSSIVDKALASASDGNTVVAATAATAAPRVAPSIPSNASVATRATMKNAINLREMNLIGVYGTPSSRRALVRMSNGRYLKVKVGDRLNGGTVTSISNSRLTYQKSGKTFALDVLPLG